MRSIVISALFESLPTHGIACLRFNFRGVEASEGAYAEGRDEPLDVVAALDAATAPGADARTARSRSSAGRSAPTWRSGIDDPRIAGWVGIAPPLRFRPEGAYDAVGGDPRPKLLVLAAHDEFRAPAEIASRDRHVELDAASRSSPARATSSSGRTDRVVDARRRVRRRN